MIASFEVQTTGIADGLAIWRASPERRACGAAVAFGTDQWLWCAKVSENFGARNTCRSARLRELERFRAGVAVA